MSPRLGQVVVLDAAASVQFAGDRGLTVRILQADDRFQYEDWVWLTVSVLGPRAARRSAPVRTVFVRRSGLRPPDDALLGMPEGVGVAAAQGGEAVPQLLG
jgi:hypothetical protein